jgi:hypothetical protein
MPARIAPPICFEPMMTLSAEDYRRIPLDDAERTQVIDAFNAANAFIVANPGVTTIIFDCKHLEAAQVVWNYLCGVGSDLPRVTMAPFDGTDGMWWRQAIGDDDDGYRISVYIPDTPHRRRGITIQEDALP